MHTWVPVWRKDLQASIGLAYIQRVEDRMEIKESTLPGGRRRLLTIVGVYEVSTVELPATCFDGMAETMIFNPGASEARDLYCERDCSDSGNMERMHNRAIEIAKGWVKAGGSEEEREEGNCVTHMLSIFDAYNLTCDMSWGSDGCELVAVITEDTTPTRQATAVRTLVFGFAVGMWCAKWQRSFRLTEGALTMCFDHTGKEEVVVND